MSTGTDRCDSTLTPRLVVRDARTAVDFYTGIFGAESLAYFEDRTGTVVHAALRIGDAMIALTEEDEASCNASPASLGGSAVILQFRCEDPDALADRIVEAGGSVVFPVADRFYGAREGRVRDPFGHLWMIGREIEDLSAEEVEHRLDQVDP